MPPVNQEYIPSENLVPPPRPVSTATLESTEPIWVLVTLDDGDEIVGNPIENALESPPRFETTEEGYIKMAELCSKPPAIVRWAAGRDFAAIDALRADETQQITLVPWSRIRRIDVLPNKTAALMRVRR